MPTPPPTTPLADQGYAAIVADPSRAVLAFDYDGVLAPIVDDPERAVAHPPAIAAMRRLAVRVGTLAIVTGRPADVVVRLGRLGDYPEFAGLIVFGHYGRERWEARTGEVVAPPGDEGVAAVRAALPRVLDSLGVAAEVWTEDKGSAMAVHTRRASDPAGRLELLRQPLAALAELHGLVVEPGRFVIELRPTGTDKGSALRTLVLERGARSVMYSGDDLGDLPAFAAVDAMRGEGIAGVKVCSGSAEVIEVARRADLVVDGPAGIAAFLNRLADELAVSPG